MRKANTILDAGWATDPNTTAQFEATLDEVRLWPPDDPRLTAARESALVELAQIQAARFLLENREDEDQNARALARALRAQQLIEEARKPWNIAAPTSPMAVALFWKSVFGMMPMVLPLGAIGQGVIFSPRHAAALESGRSYLYTMPPADHVALVASPDDVAQIINAHDLPESLSWRDCAGKRVVLFRCSRPFAGLNGPRVQMSPSRSVRNRFRLILSDLRWTVEPAAALMPNSDKLPPLPNSLLDRLAALSPDGQGPRLAEKFLFEGN